MNQFSKEKLRIMNEFYKMVEKTSLLKLFFFTPSLSLSGLSKKRENIYINKRYLPGEG
jgi:hypothetical protein